MLLAAWVALTAPTIFAERIAAAGEPAAGTNRTATLASGKILVTSPPRVLLIERASKAVLWESNGLHGANCISALPGGGFLVGEGKSIAQIDSNGKFISRSPALFELTTDVKPLDGERMLVSDGPAGTVSEMDWSGKVTWSIKGLHFPSEAVRLDNGNTLVADGTAELKEFDSAGKKIRGTWVKQWAASVQKVFGGTLIGESRWVELLDDNNHARWSRPIASRVTGVQQLLSGEYLISEPDAGRIAILDSDGNVVWETAGLRYPWRAIYVE